MGIFRKPPPCPPHPRIDGVIKVSSEDGERLLSVPEFESLVEAAFIPQLDFSDLFLIEKIASQSHRFHASGKLTRQQLWLGSYFMKEIESLFIPDVTIRWIDSSVGWGVFADRPFKEMEYITEYSGKLRRRKRADQKNGYCFQYVIAENIVTPYVIDARDQGGIGRLINHSATPNLTAILATIYGISHIILVAREAIPKGAQLLFDYGTGYWSCRSAPKQL